MRSERFDSQELGSKFEVVIDASSIKVHPSVSDGFEIHITLKDVGHDCLFAKTPSFNPGDLMVLVGDVHLLSIQPDNAGQLGDQVMTRGKHQTILHLYQFLTLSFQFLFQYQLHFYSSPFTVKLLVKILGMRHEKSSSTGIPEEFIGVICSGDTPQK